jgi:hypothetical protein
MGFEDAILQFRKNYQRRKLAFFIAGGGFSILDFRKYPGTNRIYHTAIEPYSEDTINFLKIHGRYNIPDPHNFQFVNAEGTVMALNALNNYCNNANLTYVVINSACTTDRYRRGENRCYIAIRNVGVRGDMIEKVYLYEMSKLSETEYNILFNKDPSIIDNIRFEEDRRISHVAMYLLEREFVEKPKLLIGESVSELSPSRNSKIEYVNDGSKVVLERV